MKKVLYLICLLVCMLFRAQNVLGQAVVYPVIVMGQIISCQGAESEGPQYEYFVVSGARLTGPVNVQASPGFMVSTNANTGFQNSISLTPTGGVVSETVFVRLGPSSPVGYLNGQITLSSAGATAQVVNVNGTILVSPMVETQPNITVQDGTTLPMLRFKGTGNAYTWTNDMPNIGLASIGIDSLPTFKAIGNKNTTVTATITATPAWAGEAYVTNSESGTISVINTLTNLVDTTISSGGKGPGSETLSPDGSKLYVLNFVSGTISVISTVTNKLLNTFPLPSTSVYPFQIALNHDGSEIYVINFGSGDFLIIDAQTGSIISDLPTGATFPSEIAFSASGNRLYIGANQNINQGKLLPYIEPGNTPLPPILVPPYLAYAGYPPPLPYVNMVFSPDSTSLYATNGSTVTVINTITQKVVGTLPTGAGGYGVAIAVALSPDGKQIYAVVNGIGGTTNEVQVFNTADNSLIQSVILPDGTPNGVCISPDGADLYISCAGSNTVSVVSTQTYQVVANVPVGSSPLINTLCVKPGGCFGNPTSFTITITPLPSITISVDSLSALTTIYGTPSPVKSFTVSGNRLTSGISMAAPSGFEISLDNVSFSSSLIINGTGTIANTTVYIRLAAADIVGTYSGNIELTSPGAIEVEVVVPNSVVTPATLIITADNKTKAYGAANPPLTASYSGFENNDGVAQLINLPSLSTTALTSSPVGKYPVFVDNASSPNYNITYVQGVLTVNPGVIIPNAFTPNNDGVNDIWDIQKIDDYPNCTVQVFNRYGAQVYYSLGYGIPWDGNYRGGRLPVGTYYYIINLNAGVPALSGFVVLIR